MLEMSMQRQQRGFSLIEVMVAVLIVAVGILGVAGMQVVSLQQNRNALLRDQALQAGNDILDRMRVNPMDYSTVELIDAPVAGRDCVASTCSPTQMRDYDRAQWKCRINPFNAEGEIYSVCTDFGIGRASLPGGLGSITLVGGVQVVTVQWVSDRNGNTTSIILKTQAN